MISYPSSEFSVYVSKIFTLDFTAKMQKKEPLIHISYFQLKRLIYLLCNNVVKPVEQIRDVGR